MVALLVGVVASSAGCGDSDGSDDDRLEGAAARGRELAEERGCQSCHSTDGSEGAGPTWEGLAGSEVELDDGTTVVADDDYLMSSILDPDADIVAGYSSGVMKSSIPPGSISHDEAEALVAYLNMLGDAAANRLMSGDGGS